MTGSAGSGTNKAKSAVLGFLLKAPGAEGKDQSWFQGLTDQLVAAGARITKYAVASP